MRKTKRKSSKRTLPRILTALFVIGAIAVYFLFFSAMSRDGEKKYIVIDENDNIDSVYSKVKPLATKTSYWVFRQMAAYSNYKNHICTGRYAIGTAGVLRTFRHISHGQQSPADLTIKSVRTLRDLTNNIGDQLMLSRIELLNQLSSKEECAKYGYTPETIIAMFVPNTYEVYWDISIDKFLEKMDKENKKFWTFERRQKAKEDKLSPVEVMTLASIVDEETDNENEMPLIAGMYINRLHIDMPLQADPTVKFATKNFEAHRIYHKWLDYDSPYNTYKYHGLPPGPIRIPSIAAIDAVLNYVHHDYIYMCAKEDFSGTHNFAKTYEEHQENAAKYAKALNERGIK